MRGQLLINLEDGEEGKLRIFATSLIRKGGSNGGSVSLPCLISHAISHFLPQTELAVGMQYIIHQF
jgi:hypothetical protein